MTSDSAAISPLLRLLQDKEAAVEDLAACIALDAYPSLTVETQRRCFDALAEPLAASLEGGLEPGASTFTDSSLPGRTASTQEASSPSAGPFDHLALALSSYVYDKLGFHGNEDDYYDPRNSYINEVLHRRTGIPISLAVMLIAIGRRCGIRVEGIGFPGHFLVRVSAGDEAGGGNHPSEGASERAASDVDTLGEHARERDSHRPHRNRAKAPGEAAQTMSTLSPVLRGTLMDPFFGGRVLTESALHRLATRFLGSAEHLRPEHLRPLKPKDMAVRMLVNLKHAYERRHDHARALVVCDRLVDITESPSFVRDRGLHALALGASHAALHDLQEYLEKNPTAKDHLAVRRAVRRAQAVSTSHMQ